MKNGRLKIHWFSLFNKQVQERIRQIWEEEFYVDKRSFIGKKDRRNGRETLNNKGCFPKTTTMEQALDFAELVRKRTQIILEIR